ncbi:MAG: branched-chain amino acid ABC transporter substrate-binding protein [Caldilineales bacterium]|nr:branched-chain amino acid ABC transporter substrate-binding protein [Caldilineales bacterium]MDW8317534.1 branched-chain amino acid ABC transporter substrate-binding protein [Anaerolineae bacterium]
MKKSIVLLSLLLVMAVILTACPAAPQQPQQQAQQPAAGQCPACTDPKGCVTIGKDEPIRIAWMFVVEGPDASLGTDTKRGVEIAKDDRPTIAGHPVELIGENEGCNAEGGQAAGTKISSDPKVVAAVGTNCSSAARAAIPLMCGAGIPMVSPSNTAPDLTAEDRPAEYWCYMRTAHNDRVQGAAMAKYAYEKGFRNAATIHDGSLYADKLQQVFAEEFKKLGGNIVAQEATDPNETNMGPMLTRIAAAKPDFIYLPIFIAAGGQVTSQAKQNPDLANVQLAGADGIFSPDFLKAAGDAAKGFLWSSPDFTAFGSGYADFLKKHEAKYGEKVLAPFHAHAYDAYNLIANAIEKVAVDCGGGVIQIPRQALRDAMISTKDMKGLTGNLTCTPTGDCADPKIAVYEGVSADPATWNPGADANSNPRKIWP